MQAWPFSSITAAGPNQNEEMILMSLGIYAAPDANRPKATVSEIYLHPRVTEEL